METTKRLLVPYPEALDLLGGIGRTKLHQLITENKVTRASIGRRSFITRESLDRFIESISTPSDD